MAGGAGRHCARGSGAPATRPRHLGAGRFARLFPTRGTFEARAAFKRVREAVALLDWTATELRGAYADSTRGADAPDAARVCLGLHRARPQQPRYPPGRLMPWRRRIAEGHPARRSVLMEDLRNRLPMRTGPAQAGDAGSAGTHGSRTTPRSRRRPVPALRHSGTTGRPRLGPKMGLETDPAPSRAMRAAVRHSVSTCHNLHYRARDRGLPVRTPTRSCPWIADNALVKRERRATDREAIWARQTRRLRAPPDPTAPRNHYRAATTEGRIRRWVAGRRWKRIDHHLAGSTGYGAHRAAQT